MIGEENEAVRIIRSSNDGSNRSNDVAQSYDFPCRTCTGGSSSDIGSIAGSVRRRGSGTSGPDAEIQKALAEAKAAEEAAAQAAEEAEAEQNARQSLVDYALQFVGGAYKAGGSDPHTGADCSGFVKYVMQYGAGISMNRSSTSQSTQGQAIDASQMQPGDLIFYGNGSRINHVAMYIGDGQIVHASTYKTGIKTSEWDYRDPVKIITMF